MNARFRMLQTVFIILLGLFVSGSDVIAQQAKSAADVFPGSTAVYLEIDDPADVIGSLMAHPLTEFIKQQKEYEQLLASPQMIGPMLGLNAISLKMGEPIIDVLTTNLGHGLYFGLDTETQGFAILFRSKDEAQLKKLAGTVLEFVAKAAKNGNGKGFERKDYRDAKAAQFDNFLVARYKDWFLVSNKPKLAKTIVDNLHDGSETTLASQHWFIQAKNQRSANESDVWAAVDLKTIRLAGVAKEFFSGRTDNAGIELVLGGILDALKNAPIAAAELSIDEQLKISVSTPFKKEWAHSARNFFYGDKFEGRAPAPLKPKNMIASLTTHRSLGEWWLSKEELFEENVVAQLAQADSQLSGFFSPLDFGEQVLGAIEPEIQIVIAENTFESDYQPDVKLPAFAIVAKLKDSEDIQRNIRVAFQSVIGIANINLGQQNQPQLDLETERMGDMRVSSASYMYDKETADGLMLFNFKPTIAFLGPNFVVSSNRKLAIELAELAQQQTDSGKTDRNNHGNTQLVIDGAALKKILAENREPLIANNMLEEGNSRREAEQAIGVVLKIAEFIKSIDLDFRIEPTRMKLELDVEIIKPETR